MILSIAHAPVDDPDADYIFGAWSDIVVGDRPDGLVDCYLSRGEGVVYMLSVWDSPESHERALQDRATHPTFGFFAACGLDPRQATYDVIGRITG